MFTASWHLFSEKPPAYANQIVGKLTVDGLLYEGIVFALAVGKLQYISGQHVKNGNVHIQSIPERYSTKTLNLLIFKDGRALASEPVTPDNVVVYDLVISTSGGGGAPTGDPATITGKVERVLDNQAEPAARQLVAIEHKPDGSWAVTGNTTSDAENGSYTLDVLTEGGDTFVLAVDEYGVPFTATAAVVQGDIIHPTIPNGHVYRVEAGGTLPATEPTWWIDTGTNHTRTIEGGISLRALPFYRPLVHGHIKAEPLP
ncbi:hypothetical protein [Endozoicomonas sp. GU-1]|uniref:hypothetical protein n=1 Tax=Endozoicomonas sp. GU-1 TaxID=3009078 RepID=UPI0022B414F1|nr:hypothetical protein [Endozoicomonas sp. GU-1]WBA83746.1 hypothetical protein O2T12_11820 [Endozoicomonas sp. GU-1]